MGLPNYLIRVYTTRITHFVTLGLPLALARSLVQHTSTRSPSSGNIEVKCNFCGVQLGFVDLMNARKGCSKGGGGDVVVLLFVCKVKNICCCTSYSIIVQLSTSAIRTSSPPSHIPKSAALSPSRQKFQISFGC